MTKLTLFLALALAVAGCSVLCGLPGVSTLAPSSCPAATPTATAVP